MTKPEPTSPTVQPDPASSSDGDGSWTDDPITQDPDVDRSVEHVIEQTRVEQARQAEQTREYGDGDTTDEG